MRSTGGIKPRRAPDARRGSAIAGVRRRRSGNVTGMRRTLLAILLACGALMPERAPAVEPPDGDRCASDPAMCASRAAPPSREVARADSGCGCGRTARHWCASNAPGCSTSAAAPRIDLLARRERDAAAPTASSCASRPTRACRRRSRCASSRGARSRWRSTRPTRPGVDRRRRAPALAGGASASTGSPSACATRRRWRPASSTRPIDDIRPPEVGSLDRRGETVEMRVLPTFSVYAPFYQSSRGYGLAVAGTTFGVFDLAQERSRDRPASASRPAATPASRRLVLRFFVGPDYSTILDEYTNAGRAVPSSRRTGRSSTGAGAASCASGAPALLDGVDGERATSPTTSPCTTRSASRPACTCSTARCWSATVRLRPLGVGRRRACRIPTRCWRRSRSAATAR